MERFDITIQMYSADASGTQYVWEKVPAEEGDFVLYADAQATIAALQAERDGWVRSREHYYQLWIRAIDERDEMRKERDDFESQLTQRTAELEAAKKVKADYDRWLSSGVYFTTAEYMAHIDEHRAELERVRGELATYKEVEVALSSKVAEYEIELNGDPQNFYGRGRTVGLRTLILALPKVEGEITEDSSDHGGEIRDGNGYVHYYATSRAKVRALLQVLQHRQGMEG